MIIIVSGVTGSGVEMFTKLLAAALDLPAYRGDDMGHWDVAEVYDRWVYADNDLDLRKLFLIEGADRTSPNLALTSEITGFISLTDGADSGVIERLLSVNEALPLVVVRYYVDDPLVLVRRVERWRSAHDLPSLRSSGYDTDMDLCAKLGCAVEASFPRIEDARVANADDAWTFAPCSKTYAQLERILSALIAHSEKGRPLVDRPYDAAPLLSEASRSKALRVWHALHVLSDAGIDLDEDDDSDDVSSRFIRYVRALIRRPDTTCSVLASCQAALEQLRDFVSYAANRMELRSLPTYMNGVKNRG